jgi:hypothetical protein
MIDERQTREFSQFCHALHAAEGGNARLQREILENGREADSHLNRILADAPIMPDGIQELSKEFTPNELKAIRRRQPLPKSLIQKAIKFMTTNHSNNSAASESTSIIPQSTRNVEFFSFSPCGLCFLLDPRLDQQGHI